MSVEFLVALNDKTITTKYDDDYFNKILSMIKDNYDASEVMLIDEFSKRTMIKRFLMKVILEMMIMSLILLMIKQKS